jgi:HEAT repeat protein
MRTIQLPAVLLGIFLAGCSERSEPVMAHGKPVSHWLEELKQPDPKARKKAVGALGAIGKADPAAIPALIGVVKDDKHALVRDQAVLALLNIGPDARDAIPALTAAESDKDATVRTHATKALQRIREGK